MFFEIEKFGKFVIFQKMQIFRICHIANFWNFQNGFFFNFPNYKLLEIFKLNFFELAKLQIFEIFPI